MYKRVMSFILQVPCKINVLSFIANFQREQKLSVIVRVDRTMTEIRKEPYSMQKMHRVKSLCYKILVK